MKHQIIIWSVFCLFSAGCVKSPDLGQTSPFESQELDACLMIVIDLSGSYQDLWDKRAYDLFLQLSDRYFNESMGTENRLIISQISGTEKALLFEGKPSDLRQQFRSPQELSNFLKENSDPDSSRVYAATRQTLDYVNTLPGLTKNTRLLTLIFSDMLDSESPSQIWDTPFPQELQDSLQCYQTLGGGIALYFVADSERQRWHQLLQETGFSAGHYLIESHLSSNPQLPRFD